MNKMNDKTLTFIIKNKMKILNWVVFILCLGSAIFIILTADEILQAMTFCELDNGDYHFDFRYLDSPHFCNSKNIYNYKPGGFDYNNSTLVDWGKLD